MCGLVEVCGKLRPKSACERSERAQHFTLHHPNQRPRSAARSAAREAGLGELKSQILMRAKRASAEFHSTPPKSKATKCSAVILGHVWLFRSSFVHKDMMWFVPEQTTSQTVASSHWRFSSASTGTPKHTHTCTYTYMHAHTYIHTHTHTHTHRQTDRQTELGD